MHIDIISVVPELLESPFSHSIMKRAKEKGLLEVNTHNLRKWAINKHGQVDDYQYGGGAGMVMMCEPLANAIDELQKEKKYDDIIFLFFILRSVQVGYLPVPDGNCIYMFNNRISMQCTHDLIIRLPHLQ